MQFFQKENCRNSIIAVIVLKENFRYSISKITIISDGAVSYLKKSLSTPRIKASTIWKPII